MKSRAAVAFGAGRPLEILQVDLEGPKAGEVLVEIRASGVCHTDEFTRSGADPEGLFPAIFGHEGAGIVVDVGPGVTSLKKGDHVIPLYYPELEGANDRPTALLNAGLEFPLAEHMGKGAVAGVGGTRLCEWWFTENAVMIDTAGRYTTQDSDAEVDRAGWDKFLDMLKRTRPQQPLNGVIVAIALGIAVITIHPPIVLFAIFMFYGLSGYGVFIVKWRRGRPVSVISTSTDEPDEEGLHR